MGEEPSRRQRFTAERKGGGGGRRGRSELELDLDVGDVETTEFDSLRLFGMFEERAEAHNNVS